MKIFLLLLILVNLSSSKDFEWINKEFNYKSEISQVHFNQDTTKIVYFNDLNGIIYIFDVQNKIISDSILGFFPTYLDFGDGDIVYFYDNLESRFIKYDLKNKLFDSERIELKIENVEFIGNNEILFCYYESPFTYLNTFNFEHKSFKTPIQVPRNGQIKTDISYTILKERNEIFTFDFKNGISFRQGDTASLKIFNLDNFEIKKTSKPLFEFKKGNPGFIDFEFYFNKFSNNYILFRYFKQFSEKLGFEYDHTDFLILDTNLNVIFNETDLGIKDLISIENEEELILKSEACYCSYGFNLNNFTFNDTTNFFPGLTLKFTNNEKVETNNNTINYYDSLSHLQGIELINTNIDNPREFFIQSIIPNNNDDILLSTGNDISMINKNNGRISNTFIEFDQKIWSANISRDMSFMAVKLFDTIALVDMNNLEVFILGSTLPNSFFYTMEFSEDNKYLVANNKDICIFDLNQKKLFNTFKFRENLKENYYFPLTIIDENRLVTSENSGNLKIYNFHTGELLDSIFASITESNKITNIVLNKERNKIAVGFIRDIIIYDLDFNIISELKDILKPTLFGRFSSIDKIKWSKNSDFIYIMNNEQIQILDWKNTIIIYNYDQLERFNYNLIRNIDFIFDSTEEYIYILNRKSLVDKDQNMLFKIKTQHLLGIELENLEYFTLYPNPANKYITIPDYALYNSIKIYNIEGELVFSSSESINNIDVSNFSKGVYFIQCRTSDKLYYSKFVKE